MVLVENSKSSCKALAKGYLLSIFHPLDCLEKACCTWNLLLIRLAGEVLPVPGQETQRTELNSLPGFAETASATKCNLKSIQRLTCLPFLILGFRYSWDLRKTSSQSHYSMLLQSGIAYGKDKVRTTLVHPSLWACRVFPFLWQQHVLLAVSSFSGVRCCDGPSAVLVIPCRCGAVRPDTSRTSFQAHTVAIRLLLAERVQYGTVLVVLTFLPWECRCFAKKPEMDGRHSWNGEIDPFTNFAGSIQHGLQYAVISIDPARTDVCHVELHC